jgi:hypothetical protein
MFDISSNSFLSLDDLNRGTSGAKPQERFSHAAAVVGDSLVVYGGRGLQYVSRNGMKMQDAYMLDDVWKLDLVKQEWTEIVMQVPMSRAYQSLVGESRFSTFWSFGGYKEVQTRTGKEYGFVFNDLLKSSLETKTTGRKQEYWEEFR